VRLLLDTHAFLWAVADAGRLSARARELISDESNELIVSAASAWELATKYRLGKLPAAEGLLDGWDEVLRRLRAEAAPVEHAHALRAGGYRVAHRDPFDRLLAAHAELEDIPLVTADSAFVAFPVTAVW
jgi:PIN domain nuclease of toxin-antitoxin system